jgi:hypothetical protein
MWIAKSGVSYPACEEQRPMPASTSTSHALDVFAWLSDNYGIAPPLPINTARSKDIALWVPRLIEPAEADRPGQLTWDVALEGSFIVRRPLLDEFIALTDADRDDVRAFARRFGPLSSSSRTGGQPHESGVESLVTELESLWRALARSLAALRDAAWEAADGAPTVHRTWAEAMAAPIVASLAGDASAEETLARLREDIDLAIAELVLGFLPLSQTEAEVVLHRIANALLNVCGVLPDSGIGDAPCDGPSFAVLTRSRTRGRDASEGPGPSFTGLLPLLALDTVGVMRDTKVYYCSGCGRRVPVAQSARRPRRDIPFYGDHDHCRRQAQLQSKRESQKRRYQRLKAARQQEAGHQGQSRPEDRQRSYSGRTVRGES